METDQEYPLKMVETQESDHFPVMTEGFKQEKLNEMLRLVSLRQQGKRDAVDMFDSSMMEDRYKDTYSRWLDFLQKSSDQEHPPPREKEGDILDISDRRGDESEVYFRVFCFILSTVSVFFISLLVAIAFFRCYRHFVKCKQEPSSAESPTEDDPGIDWAGLLENFPPYTRPSSRPPSYCSVARTDQDLLPSYTQACRLQPSTNQYNLIFNKNYDNSA